MHTKLLFTLFTFALQCFAQTSKWQLVWSDEFDGGAINTTKWTYEETCKPQNSELQCYTPRSDNSYISNGNLVLKVIPEAYGGRKFTSARMRSSCDPNGSFKRGRFEMRAMLPRAKHHWPAFWLIPTDQVYGGWPKSGEIDIMEYRGQETSKMSSALHYGSPHAVTNTGPMQFDGVDFSREYHLFALEWDEKQMKWFVDSKNTFTVPMDKSWGSFYSKNGQPWDQRFHVIINVAVGGNFFTGYPPLTDADVQKWEKPTMEIDYIRVYQDTTNPSQHVTSYSGPAGGGKCKSNGVLSSNTAVIGISVGVAVIAVVVIALIVGIWRRRRFSNQSRISSEESS